jgi:hypothetical protein
MGWKKDMVGYKIQFALIYNTLPRQITGVIHFLSVTAEKSRGLLPTP